MERVPYEDLIDGHGDAPKYYYVPEPKVPSYLRQAFYTTGYSDDVSSDATYHRRPSVLAPHYYRPIRSRRRPTKLCLPVVSRPEPRRRYSVVPNISTLSDDLDVFLNMYDNEGEYDWPEAYQHQSRVGYFPPPTAAKPLKTKRRLFAASAPVPTGITMPLASRKHIRKAELPSTRHHPIILQVTGQGLTKSDPTVKAQKISSSKAARKKQLNNMLAMKSRWEALKDSSEISESEDSQQFLPKTDSNSSAIHKAHTIPSRFLKNAKQGGRNSKAAFITSWLPKPRRSTLQDRKQTKKTSYVKSNYLEIIDDLLRDTTQQDHTSQHDHTSQQDVLEPNEETQITNSDAGDMKSVGSSLVNQSVVRSLKTVQEDKEAASQSTSYIQMDAGEAIEAVHKSSYTKLDPELCVKLTQTLTDKLVTTSTQANQGFVMIPEQPEFIKTLKQLQKDHLEHIHRETKRLLALHKYVEDHQNAYISSISPQK